MTRKIRFLLGVLLLALPLSAWAQTTPPPQQDAPASTAVTGPLVMPEEARASDHFDPETATRAYMALMPKAARERSNAYFEGLYWLSLWDFLVGALAAWLVLSTRLSARMRDLAVRITRFKPIQTVLYWAQYVVITSILTFPLDCYEGFFREHYYGLATQTFGPWLGDQLKSTLVAIILGGILVTLLFGVVRLLPNTWWIWGSVVSIAFIIFSVLIAPIYVVPIFNKVSLLEDRTIKDPILSMARANGIPAKDVYEIDASRQTNRMSANVSGFGSTMRITLNDNLLRRGSPEEIKSVMGHEMGHYVLNHVYNGIIFFIIVITLAFAYFRVSLGWALGRWGRNWGISGVGDLAVVPLVFILGSVFFFVASPILNTFTRTQEAEADMFGLNASREPDGFAQAAIHLGEYRKMDPGPIEEWIFFDHPSGYHRIYSAMRWKGENLKFLEASAAAKGSPTP